MRGGGGGGGGGSRGGRGAHRDVRPSGSRGGDRDRDRGRGRDYHHRHRSPDWRRADHRPRRRSASPDRDRRARQYARRDDVPRHGHRDHLGYQHHHRARGTSGVSGGYEMPPDYMLPEHPTDLGQPMRRVIKEGEFLGDPGLLGVDVADLGRHKPLFLDRGSPPMPALPRTLYPTVPPVDTGYTTGASAMKTNVAFGAHDRNVLRYHEHLHDPYLERDKERERLYSSRDVLGPDMPTSTNLRAFSGPSSSTLAKERSYEMHSNHSREPGNGYVIDGLGRLSHEPLGHVSGHRFLEKPLGHGSAHGEIILPESGTQTHTVHQPRGVEMGYGVHKYSRSDKTDDMYLASEDIYGNVGRSSRANITGTLGSSSFMGLREERIDNQVRLSQKATAEESSFHDMHHDKGHGVRHSFHGDAATRFQKTRGLYEDYTHTLGERDLELPGGSVRRHLVTSFEEGYALGGRDSSPMVYRGRSRSPAYLDHEMDMYHSDVSSPRRDYYEDEMDAYGGLTPERMQGRDYVMVDDKKGYDVRNTMSNGRDVFSRITLPNNVDEEWADGDQGNHLCSNRWAHGHSKYNMIFDRLSRPTGLLQHGELSTHKRGGWTKNVKKRSRPALHQFHSGYISGRNEFVRPNKISKWSEDKQNSSHVNHKDAPEDEDLSMKKDPPEGSEEFNLQVDQAFLKFSKMLNESPSRQKSYREAPKGSLLCCVCGSVSRKFPDIDALISHTYDTCKVGLKTKHLGLHKALCVLMGWNWRVAPDTSKSYHSIPAEQANAMKEDLILWPPLVIIHNGTIGEKATATKAKIITVEEIGGVLRDIGVANFKSKVSHGRPANQSVFLVKFRGTFSGLQEAKKIHDHFASRNHGKEELQKGKEELQKIRGGNAKKDVPVGKVEELLYAHIAVAEDLVYLDEGTKKRYWVRSKKDIEAIGDAPLKFDS